jgi:hypothetical protein
MSNQTQPLSHRKLVARINILLSLTVVFFPFLLIWSIWLFTGFAFSPTAIFQSDEFWSGTIVYQFIFGWCAVVAIWDSPKPINRKS